MARFCTKCGNALGEDDLFCLNCGQKYVSADPAPVQPAPVQQPICPPPPPPMGAKPPVPGRGLGIASMVMGLYGILSNFGLFYAMYLIWYVEDQAGVPDTMRGNINEYVWEVLIPCFFALFIVAVLGLVFSALAKAKGYRNGISNAGMALSIPSLVLWLAGLIFLLA